MVEMDIPVHVRAWLYRVLTAAVPLMIGYGVVSEQQSVLWVSLVASVLGTGTATAYTSTKKPAPVDE
jgi:hypothetical protein